MATKQLKQILGEYLKGTDFKEINNTISIQTSWEKIVDVQVFLTNMKDDFKTYNKIYAEYFKGNQPCRTTIEIKSLPTPIAIELKIIANI